MQRQVVAEFPNQDMGQQTRTRQTAVDGQAGHWCQGDALAAKAGHFRTHVPGDAERSQDVFQNFGHVFAQTRQRAAAFRTGTGGWVLHDVARQAFRQWFAFGFPPGLGFRFLWRGLSVFFLKIADHQLKLIDLASESL